MRSLKRVLCALAVMLTATLSSCEQTGETKDYHDLVVQFKNTKYKFKRITLDEHSGERVYIMYPINDTAKTLPQVVNYDVSDGDDTKQEVTVQLK